MSAQSTGPALGGREGGRRSRPRSAAAGVLAARLAIPTAATAGQGLVGRQRLYELLDEGVGRPLTLVHGPAGSGKTVLVAAWVAENRSPFPVAWVTLDSDADAPGAFWAYVLQALRGGGLLGQDDVGTPARADEIDRSFLSRLAAALSEMSGPVVLVLDEYDRVSPGPVDRELEFVLRYASPRLRLVVVCRHRPPLRLARLRVAGDLCEIGPDALAFTAAETTQLLRMQGVRLASPAVDDLTARTEGWATGLRLSALALQHGADPRELHQLLAAGHGDVADFLLSEVVDEQPAETQDLLLRTCILERVTGELADELTGRSDGQRILHELAISGSFVRMVPGPTTWFAYHELFSSALRGRLALLHPELVPDLHRRASRWLADHGRLTEAVAHAGAADDWELAADLVVDHLAVGHLLVGLEVRRLATLLAGMPTPDTTASMAAVRAALAMARFDVEGCLAALDRVPAALGAVPPDRRAPVRLAAATVRVIVSRLTGDLAGGQAAGIEARTLVAQVAPDRLAEHPELLALVLSSLGTLQLWGGALDAAEQTLEDGAAGPAEPFTEYARSNCLGQLALVHCLRGRLRQANESAVAALQLVDRSGQSPVTRVPVGHLAAAEVAWEWNDLPAVRTHVEQAARSAAARADPSLAVLVAQLRARYRSAQGDAPGALRLLHEVADERRKLPPESFVTAPLVVDEALAYLAGGDPDEALTTLRRLPDGPDRRIGLARVRLATGQPGEALAELGDAADDPSLPPALAIRAQLAAAAALDATGHPGEALRRLEGALAAARTEGFRRPFVEASPWWRQALEPHVHLLREHGWLTGRPSGRVARPAPDAGPPGLVVEPLTARELEVLRLAAQPMSSREVAETLHLSVNTVKTHLRSIYRKLAAPTRNTAVRRARALGIL